MGNSNDISRAMFCIGYGLYALTVNDGKKDNALIVNTVTQLTSTPNRVAVAVNKQNYSHDVMCDTGVMNINCLAENTPFSVFQQFGFQSGRNTDKFKGESLEHSENGLVILPKYSNAYISLQTDQYIDVDTHGLFICKVTDAKIINDTPTMTYTYYQKNVKPKPEKQEKKGYVCKICGYVYEGDTLPDDFVCPICKHGAVDFEELK